MGPDVKEPGDNRTLNSPINELESRLLKQRKVLIFGAINDKVARDVTGGCSRWPARAAARSTCTSTRPAATWRAATPSTT